MGREFELKYQATPEIIAELRGKFGDFTPISMETTYFDTEDLSLRQRRWTLRQRLENGRAVCTVKTPLPDGSRGEWEAENSDLSADSDIYQGIRIPELGPYARTRTPARPTYRFFKYLVSIIETEIRKHILSMSADTSRIMFVSY